MGAVTLSHHRGGSGPPLLLVHGVGSHWQVWEPVLAALEAEREVVAVDLPGFGGSPVLEGDAPTAPALARAVGRFLDELGWERAHVAGNSLGGWIALELAKTGRALSACALSPGGFYNRWERAYARLSLKSAQTSARRFEPFLERAYAKAWLRRLALSQLQARPERMPAAAAVAATVNLARSPGWDATIEAITHEHFTGAADVRGPVTVAWGEKDRLLLPRQAERARAALPRARHVTLFGCGHVPTWDDPGLVARTILTSG